MSSRDYPSSEGVEMVLQAGVARLGPPSRHATDIPPSRMARARTTRPQCILYTLVITPLDWVDKLFIYSLFVRGFCKGRGIALPAWKAAKACLPSRIPLDADGGPSFLFAERPRTQALPAQRRRRGDP